MKILLLAITGYDPVAETTTTYRYATRGYNEYPDNYPPQVVYLEEYESGAYRFTDVAADADVYFQESGGVITLDDSATGALEPYSANGIIRLREA